MLACSSADLTEDDQDRNTEEHEGSSQDLFPSLSFCAPEALLNPPNAHPLQIFVILILNTVRCYLKCNFKLFHLINFFILLQNPAPNVYAFKPPPLYLECDLDFHLCPLPRDPSKGMYAPTTQKKFLDRKVRWKFRE